MQTVMDECSQIYPMEICAPTGLIASCKLRTYQKQSLSFMVNREKGAHDTDYKTGPMKRLLFRRQVGKSDYSHTFENIKTGILASEVGMGKSLVCIALVLANPGSIKKMSAANFAKATRPLETKPPNRQSVTGRYGRVKKKDINKAPNSRLCEQVCVNDLVQGLYKVKTTVISTTNTIVGQWYDEIKKFAPTLNVKVHHGSYSSSPDFFNPASNYTKSQMQDIDILLTVNTTAPPSWCCRLTFHRVIVDEIHQYFIPYYHSQNIWGVTATPFEKLSGIFTKFGQNVGGLGLGTKWNLLSYQQNPANQTAFVEAMNVFMIRHTKNQKIEGQAGTL